MPSKIGDMYALELSEVRARAHALGDAVEQHNYLPHNFPKLQIALLVKALAGLSDGSLEGTKYPLEHAATRLSEIRRRFFLPSGAGTPFETKEIDAPYLERGDALDTYFSSIISAISTALDAYREQAREDFESTNTDDYIDVLPGFADSKKDIAKIEKQILQFAELSISAQDSQWVGNDLVAETARSAADARNSLASTEAEASFDILISGWIKRLALISAEALKYLQVSIDAVAAAGGIAHIFYNKYKQTIKNIRETAISEAKDWLILIKSQLKTAEFALREKYSEDERNRIGIIRSAGRNRIVLSHDNIPFAISGKEKNTPLQGDIVEFSIDRSKDKLLAKDIRPTKEYIIMNGTVYKSSEATPFVYQQLMNILAGTKKKSMRVDALQRTALTQLGLPYNYWIYLGFQSFLEFLESNKKWNIFPNHGVPQVVSLFETDFRNITTQQIKEFAVGLLFEKGPTSLSDVADLASNHFIRGAVPIKTIIGVGKFSDIFYNDPIFTIDDGVLYLAGDR